MTDTQKRPTPIFHLIMIVSAVTVVWAYWPTWVSLIATWMSDPDYNHGFLVIPISLWLLWQRREMLADVEIQPSWWGLVPLIVAGVIRWAGAEFFISQFEAWSIPLWVCGCVLLFGGWGLLRWSAGAIAFLWFMTPLPASLTNFITLPLQKVSAVLSTWTLHLFAQPAVRQGTTIVLGEHILDVERACSGLRICYGTLAVAVAFSVLMRPRWHRVLILIGASIPVAVIANSMRVTGTGLLYLVVEGDKAHKIAHDFAGFVMLPLSLGLLWLVNFICDRATAAFSRSSQEGGKFLLKLGAPAAVILCGLVFWQIYQADKALKSLLDVAAQHEADALKSDGEDALKEWGMAARYLDHYCRLQAEDWDDGDPNGGLDESEAEEYRNAAIRLAEAADQLALNRTGAARARRYFQRAWELNPDQIDLAMNVLRLGFAGQQYDEVMRVADQLISELPEDDDDHRLEAFQFKVFAVVGDAESIAADRSSWDDVADVLRYGIENDLDAVMCAYRLALIYRERPVRDVDGTRIRNPETAAELLLREMLIQHGSGDPLAWLVRCQFRQRYDPVALDDDDLRDQQQASPALEPLLTQSADADLDRAIALAESKDDPTMLSVWLLAAQRAEDNDDFAAAIEFAKRAQEANQDHFRPYLLLARLTTDPDALDGENDEEQQRLRLEAIALLKKAREREALANELLLEVEQYRQQWLSDLEAQVTEADAGVRELRSELSQLPPLNALPVKLNLALVQAEALSANDYHADAAQLLHDVLTEESVVEAESIEGVGELIGRAWLTLGDYQDKSNDLVAAQESYDRGRRLEPDSVTNTAFRAFEAEQSGQFSRAAELYGELGQRLGDRPEILLGRVRSRLNLARQIPPEYRNLTGIADMLESAEAAGASSEEAAVLRADYYALSEDPVAALRVLESAVAETPSAALWQRLISLRELSGDSAGADAALQQFEKLVESPVAATLVRAELLQRREDFDAAASILDQSLAKDLSLDEKFALFERRMVVEASRGDASDVEALLQQYSAEFGDEPLFYQRIAEYYWNQDELEKMKVAEQKLVALLGEESDVWQKLTARRLIHEAGQAENEAQKDSMLQEARDLISRIPDNAANRREVATLQGRLARAEGRLGDALDQLRRAWEAKNNPVPEGVEYLMALSAAGDVAGSTSLMTELENYIVALPQIFDAALGMNWKFFDEKPELAVAVAQNWANTREDADSYLRLARTLSRPSVRRAARRSQELDDAIDAAYRKSLELEPENPQIWGELLRFVSSRESATTLAVFKLLDDLLNESSMQELDRVFAAAQLLSERNVAPQAARYWHRAIELTETGFAHSIRQRVLLRASYFFARQDASKAMELLEAALAIGPADAEATRLLISLLASEENVDSFRRASELAEGLLNSDRMVLDADRRVMARLLYLRATKFPDDFDPAADLSRAARLLDSVRAKGEADAVLISQVTAELGDPRSALLQLSDLAGRSTAEVATIGSFVQFWQDEFADQSVMVAEKDAALRRLETIQNAELVSLDLRLRPDDLSQTQKQSIVNSFVERVIGAAPTEQRKSQLIQSLFQYLRRNDHQAEAIQLLKMQSPPGGVASRSELFTGATVAAFSTVESDQYQKDIGSLLPSILAETDDMDLVRAAADFYFLRGDWADARPLYLKCLEENPKDIGVTNNLALVVAASTGDFDQAKSYLDQAEAAADGDELSLGYLRDSHAWLLLTQGKAAEAYEILAPLSQSSSTEATTLLHLAAAAKELGKTEEAKQALQTARNMGIESEPLPPIERAIIEQLTNTENASASLK